MAKGDQERTNKNLVQSQDRANTQYGILDTEQGKAAPAINDAGASERSTLLSGLTGMSQTGGIDPEAAARLRGYATPGVSRGSSGAGGGGGGGESSGGSPPAGPPPAPLYSDPYAGYKEFSNTGGVNYGALTQFMPTFQEMSGKDAGFDPTRLANINASSQGMRDIGTTGGYDPAELAKIRGDISNIRSGAETGGYDPTQLAGLRGTVNQLRTYGQTGGLTPEDIAGFHDPGFEEFSQTGGFNPGQISTYRNANTAAAQGLGNTQQRQLQQAQRINPTGANYAASVAKAARGNAQGMGEAALSGELNLNNAINAGRQYGISGRAGQAQALGSLLSQNRINATNAAAGQGGALEGNVATNKFNMTKAAAEGTGNLEQALTQNRLAGLTGSGSLDLSTQQAINSSRLGAATGGSNAIAGAEGLVQSGRLAGLGGMTNIEGMRQDDAQAASNAADAAAAQAAALGENQYQFDSSADFANRQFGGGIEEYLMNTGQQGQLAGLTGLQNLYGQTYGPGQQNFENRLAVANNQTGANQNFVGQRTQLAAMPGKFQTGFNNAMQGAGAVAGLVGAFNPTSTAGARGTNAPIAKRPTDIRV